MEYTDRQW